MCACRSARLKQIAEARAQGVGSAYRSSSMGLALRFLRRLHGGACDRQEVSANRRARSRTQARTDGGGWTTGRSGAAHLAWAAERDSSGRASRCSTSAVRRSERRALPFRGAQRGRGACVWRAHAHALTVCCGCAGRTGLWYLYMRIHICTRTCTACVCAIGPAGYSQPRHGRLPHYT